MTRKQNDQVWLIGHMVIEKEDGIRVVEIAEDQVQKEIES
jgi:hypothetical protein